LEVYQPILDYLRESLDDADNIDVEVMKEKLGAFSGWVAIVGSDEAVRAFGHYMQGGFSDAPPLILMRLYAEFQLTARRDLGDPESELNPMDVWTMRINDLLTEEGKVLRDTLTLPFGRACAMHAWRCPWLPSTSSPAKTPG
jgi:hypothetical protein